MFARLGVTESLGETEINHIDVVLFLANADQEVVRLDVAVKEVPGVHKLNPLQLKHANKLEIRTIDAGSTARVFEKGEWYLPFGQQA